MPGRAYASSVFSTFRITCVDSAPSNRHNILADRTKNRVTIRIQHLDFHRIASAHKRRLGLAVVDGLDHPDFGDAAIAEAAFADRLAGVAIGALVGDGAGSDDRAG